jgi:hypothetical protein
MFIQKFRLQNYSMNFDVIRHSGFILKSVGRISFGQYVFNM